jgi:hypothetical protein
MKLIYIKVYTNDEPELITRFQCKDEDVKWLIEDIRELQEKYHERGE